MGRKQVVIEAVDTTPPVLNLTPEDIDEVAEELVEYHNAFAGLYYRSEQAQWGYKYLQGLMLPIERKAIQPLALALEGGDIQAMQQFIGQGRWQDKRLLHRHWELVGETLGDADGVLIVDGSGFPKKGQQSVGVARQWCGNLGKVENCQVGVFSAYASRQGYTLLEGQLYLPEEWFDAEHGERWVQCGIPEGTPFKTQPELALDLIQAVLNSGHLACRWLACDEFFGRDAAFLDRVAGWGLWYLAEVPHDTQVWLSRPETGVPVWSGRGRRPTRPRVKPGQAAALRVDAIAAQLPAQAWQAYLIREGSQGPLVADVAFLRGVAGREGLPGPEVWLVLRRSLGAEPELKTFLSNAPAATPHADLVPISALRWPVQMSIEECKGGLGMIIMKSVPGWAGIIT